MMLAGSRLRVALVTIHLPLAQVPGKLTTEAVFKTIRITDDALRSHFGIPKPRLAVAGLNPHAGENGLFGDEEIQIISPAIREAAEAGMDVSGPHPPDTVFHRAIEGQWDAVVCMYHDQGLIPFKMVHFSDGVNVTLGLPIVRTSVDHGTAYDIAGTGKADPGSLVAAIRMAAEHATHGATKTGK
jgi:4-hydroxythreonine-4-phosphate dehydrogenase